MIKRATTIPEIKKIALPILRKAHVSAASIFGSIARGEAKAKSDVDFLVRFSKQISLFDLVDLRDILTKALGRKADIITYKGLSPKVRSYVKKDMIKIL